jgi:SNF2 family DNA or RNA helicase
MNNVLDALYSSGKKYFGNQFFSEGLRLYQSSQFSLSFLRDNSDSYYVVSGIVKDRRNHEVKLVYKQRLEDTPQGPITSNCDCTEWSMNRHCPHVACLYVIRSVSNSEGKDALQQVKELDATTARANKYGTIINGPNELLKTKGNNTYSTLQYLLTNKKVISFPIPSKFEGSLFINITSREIFDELTNSYIPYPQIGFSYEDEDGKSQENISLFENLYLFNWDNGVALTLHPKIKDFIRYMRISNGPICINDLLRTFLNFDFEDYCRISIDGVLTQDIPKIECTPTVTLNPTKKKGPLQLSLFFKDENDYVVTPPNFLRSFTFTNGLLGSFKKKKDSYDFIGQVVRDVDLQTTDYKKLLIYSKAKTEWSKLLNFVLNNDITQQYEKNKKAIYQFHNDLLLKFIAAFYDSFGENFFRFSEFSPSENMINFTVSNNVIFQGIFDFHKKVTPFGTNIFYNKTEVSFWNSKISFERKNSSLNWFDLNLKVSKDDLKIIKNVSIDENTATVGDKLVLFTPDQKELLKFMKKYTRSDFESENPNEEVEEDMALFHVPMKRARIFELFELKKLGISGALTDEENQLCERLINLKEIPEYEMPEKLKGVLRPYQQTGYNWLRFLYESKLGACLADDMGLGKTLQALSLIEALYDKVEKILIICPVSLLLNWENEIGKFIQRDHVIYHGGDRVFPTDKKLIITSYGVMRKEAAGLASKAHFDILIMDEVQHLKNIRSLGANAARQLNADFRLCLTGTPVENDLSEFYNIIDLSIPGIWGDLKNIRGKAGQKSRVMAKKVSAPFILRRRKSQVLSELPPKIENDVFLNHDEVQKENYDALLEKIRNDIQKSTSKKRYGEILRGLLRLRQSCLWQYQKPNKKDQIYSTKVEFLLETLEQIIEEGHQAIVFSQFTTYLDLIQKEVENKHWSMARIDGSQSTKKRQKQVELFQEKGHSVFLISLKAGGVGLNLTAASYVFIMDPWWNPAVESQAIDRAHRIGQKNTLTVYRPIIKDSIEEKVLLLQKAKRELFYDLLPEDDEMLYTGKLSMKDFESLFNP